MPKTVETRRHCEVGLRACNSLPQPSGVFTEKYVYTKFCLDWLLCESVTWPYMSLS